MWVATLVPELLFILPGMCAVQKAISTMVTLVNKQGAKHPDYFSERRFNKLLA